MSDIYLSFFMFTTDVKPADPGYRDILVKHMHELQAMGYMGFEFPIAPPASGDALNYQQDLDNYKSLWEHLNNMGLEQVKIATNVGATRTFDPSSPYPEQQHQALDYLKSRVDITAALGGDIMMGPIIVPYGAFPTTDFGGPIWSDDLQEHLQRRYATAQPVLNELGYYAGQQGVKLAIEPITHWETPGPNKLSQVIEFLDGMDSDSVGVVIDSAHEILDGDGSELFAIQVQHLASQGRLNYVQVSAPDRGALHTSWIPWESFLRPILAYYQGPIAVEVFNALPVFASSLRLSRRKFWIPGEDPETEYPSAYDIAAKAFEVTQQGIRWFR